MAPKVEEMDQLLFRYVKVKTKVGCKEDFQCPFLFTSDSEQGSKLSYDGYLKAIDPIDGSVILCKLHCGKVNKNALILGHVIESIDALQIQNAISQDEVRQIIETDRKLKLSEHPFFKTGTTCEPISEESIISRRCSIVRYLKRCRIPYQYDLSTNQIHVAERATIKAPYDHISHYTCPSRIVLKRLKYLVDCSIEQSTIQTEES